MPRTRALPALAALAVLLAYSAAALELPTYVHEIRTDNNLGDVYPAAIVTDEARARVYVVGTLTFNLPGLPAVRGTSDVFVVCYRQTDGIVLWKTQFGSTAADRAISAHIRPDNFDLVITGWTRGQIGDTPQKGIQDGFIYVFDKFGYKSWSYQFGIPNGFTYPLGLKQMTDSFKQYIVVATATDTAFNTLGNNTMIILSARWNGLITSEIAETMVTGPLGYFGLYSFAVASNRTMVGYELWANVSRSNTCPFTRTTLNQQQYWIRLYDRRGNLLMSNVTRVYANNADTTGVPVAFVEPGTITYNPLEDAFWVIGQVPGTLNPYIGPESTAINNFQTCLASTGIFSFTVRYQSQTGTRTTQVRFSDTVNGLTFNRRFNIRAAAQFDTVASAMIVTISLFNNGVASTQYNVISRDALTPTNRFSAPGPTGMTSLFQQDLSNLRSSSSSVFVASLTRQNSTDICNPLGPGVRSVQLGIATGTNNLLLGTVIGTSCDTVGTAVTAKSASNRSFFLVGSTTGSLTGFQNTAKKLITWLIKGDALSGALPQLSYYCNVGPQCSNAPTPSPDVFTPSPTPRPDCSNGTHCPCLIATFERCLTAKPAQPGLCDTSPCSGLVCDCASSFLCKFKHQSSLVPIGNPVGNDMPCALSSSAVFPVPLWAPL